MPLYSEAPPGAKNQRFNGMNILRILNISRPRFWIYEFGTYLLGVFAGISYLEQPNYFYIIIFGLFFIFPANLLIYGVNDIFDYETDRLNPKKTGYEDLLDPSLHKKVFFYIFVTNIPFLILSFFVSGKAFVALLLFYFFAIFYSALPIRAKIRPFFDSFFSASHYVVTGVFGYFLVGGEGSIVLPVLAGISWAMAMHAYSAVPDIFADRESGIQTIATKLEKQKTILLCALLYLLSALLVLPYVSYVGLILAVPYLFLMFKSYKAEDAQLFRYYKYFPKLNSLVGMIIFFIIALKVF